METYTKKVGAVVAMRKKRGCRWRHAPHPLSLKTRGGGGGLGVSHTRTGPGRPPWMRHEVVEIWSTKGKEQRWEEKEAPILPLATVGVEKFKVMPLLPGFGDVT